MFNLRTPLLTCAIITGFIAYNSEVWAEMSKKQFNDRMDQVEKDATLRCLVLMEQINEELLSVYDSTPDVNPRTLRMIEAYEGYCKNM